MAIRYLSTTENLQKQPIIDPRDSPPNRSREGQLYYNTNSKGLQLYDGTSWSSVGSPGTVTSVGLSMPTAFSVANSPITGSGTFSVTGAGTSSQVVLGDGTLGPLPTGDVTGTGTTNYISKFTSSSAIGDSIVFDNGTNVGIGTASPSEKLHVEGVIQVDTGVANRNAQLRDDGLYISRTSDGSRILQIRAASNSNSMDIKARTSINFLLNGAEKVSINQSGVALEVTGAGSFSGFVRSNFLNNYANSRSIIGAPSNYVSIYDGSGVEAVRVDSSGNVGIGTTSPSVKLDVVSDGVTSAKFTNSNASTHIFDTNSGEVRFQMTTGYSGNTYGLATYYGGKMAYMVNGIVFISDGSGNTTFGNSTTSLGARVGIKGSGTGNSTSSLLVQNSATTELFRVRDDGSVYALGSGAIATNTAFGKEAFKK